VAGGVADSFQLTAVSSQQRKEAFQNLTFPFSVIMSEAKNLVILTALDPSRRSG
jgi:hypothetical protein